MKPHESGFVLEGVDQIQAAAYAANLAARTLGKDHAQHSTYEQLNLALDTYVSVEAHSPSDDPVEYSVEGQLGSTLMMLAMRLAADHGRDVAKVQTLRTMLAEYDEQQQQIAEDPNTPDDPAV